MAEAVRDVVEAGERGADVAARASPEELGGRGGAGPDGVVEVLGAGLLGPEEVLAAEDELGLGRGQVRDGVERVRVLPGLEGVAPRVAVGEGTDPRAVTAVLRQGEIGVSRARERRSALGRDVDVRGRSSPKRRG